ncbi:MAG: PAS domain S-box protein [Candidatus Roizmanbacteria bacterium]|nr:PAS domain S-box protein [Candidatus Roizmanbacteria bacterium]
MSLKLRSALISFGSIILIVIVMGGVIFTFVLSGFQTVENQRVERSIESVKFAMSDKYSQLESQLADWTIWDDTYNFMSNHDKAYITSNLNKEQFIKTGIDEVLFIYKDGSLAESLIVAEENDNSGNKIPELYSYFATGSALTRFEKNISRKSGILQLKDKILFFSVGEILKSDESGPPNGYMVFGTYLDSEIVGNIKNLTQLNTTFIQWNDTTMTTDFTAMKDVYSHGEKQQIIKLDTKIIGGYLVIEDIFGKPTGIFKIDVLRDITQQGKASMITLMIVLIISGLLGAALNNWLVTGVVLKGILNISAEIKDLGKTNSLTRRMREGTDKDELDELRLNINNMLSDIQQSQAKLKVEMGKQESLLELINVVVVMLDQNGCVSQINRKGCETLGYTYQEIIGMNWIESIIVPEERELMKKKFTEIVNSNMTNNAYIENSILTKDKKVVIFGWNNTIVKDSKGAMLSTLSVGNDITKKKKEENAKEDYTNTLKRLNEIMVGRELKMIELKEKLKRYEV